MRDKDTLFDHKTVFYETRFKAFSETRMWQIRKKHRMNGTTTRKWKQIVIILEQSGF